MPKPSRCDLREGLLEGPIFVRVKFLGTDFPGRERPLPKKHTTKDIQVREVEDILTRVDEWLGSAGSWTLLDAANMPSSVETWRHIAGSTTSRNPMVVHVSNTQTVLVTKLDDLAKKYLDLELLLRGLQEHQKQTEAQAIEFIAKLDDFQEKLARHPDDREYDPEFAEREMHESLLRIRAKSPAVVERLQGHLNMFSSLKNRFKNTKNRVRLKVPRCRACSLPLLRMLNLVTLGISLFSLWCSKSVVKTAGVMREDVAGVQQNTSDMMSTIERLNESLMAAHQKDMDALDDIRSQAANHSQTLQLQDELRNDMRKLEILRRHMANRIDALNRTLLDGLDIVRQNRREIDDTLAEAHEIEKNISRAEGIVKYLKAQVDKDEKEARKYSEVWALRQDLDGNVTLLRQQVHALSRHMAGNMSRLRDEIHTQVESVEKDIDRVFEDERSDASEAASKVQQTRQYLSGNMSRIHTKVSELDAKIADFRTQFEGNVRDLNERFASERSSRHHLVDQVRRYNSTETRLVLNEAAIQTALRNVSQAQDQLNGVVQTVRDLQDKLMHPKDEDQLNSLSKQVDGLASDDDDAAKQLGSLAKKVDGLASDDDDAAKRLDSLEQAVHGLESQSQHPKVLERLRAANISRGQRSHANLSAQGNRTELRHEDMLQAAFHSSAEVSRPVDWVDKPTEATRHVNGSSSGAVAA